MFGDLYMRSDDSKSPDPTPWSEIPIEVLRAELLKRVGEDYEKPECGSKGQRASYNTSLHVFALILILALSTADQQHARSQ
ncbi:MAG: hypothetical protein Q9191_008039 [Dirinaria sp. TL-2023a]